MTVAENIKNILKKVAPDIKALATRLGFLEKNLNYLTAKISSERSDPDDEGIYRLITYRRENGTILQVTRLEHDVTLDVVGGVYNKRVTLVYNRAGTDVIDVTSYHLTYDSYNCIVSETLIP